MMMMVIYSYLVLNEFMSIMLFAIMALTKTMKNKKLVYMCLLLMFAKLVVILHEWLPVLRLKVKILGSYMLNFNEFEKLNCYGNLR